MKATFCRLGEYKIIEDDNGALWWEAHAGLSALVGGKCFILMVPQLSLHCEAPSPCPLPQAWGRGIG